MVAFTNVALAALASFAAAHPGEKHSPSHMKRELDARDNAARLAARSLAACGNSEHALALKSRSIQRRADKVKSIREKRGIKSAARKDKRALEDLESWEAVNHNMTGTYDYDMFSSISEVFDAETSCILAPNVTNGPYYVAGEYMRSNVIEDEFCDGVNMFLEVQYIDINTCEPIPAVAVDVWNCNATGVYAGIDTETSGQGGLNSTFLRGIQLTDHDGVVQFETIFPGHYSGRAVHTHLLAHTNATIEPNGTISIWDAPVAHIGQLFYPEDLRQEIEALAPYNTNTVEVTTNDEDMWSVLQADAAFDPIPEFIYLGDSVEDGLFAWIQIGINSSTDFRGDSYYGVAAYLGADGGHSTGYTVGGGGGGGDPGNGTGPGNGTAPGDGGAPPS